MGVRQGQDSGYALLSAVMALGILALLSCTMIVVSAGGATRARSDLLQSQADAFGGAILARAALALQDSRRALRPRIDGVPTDLNVLGVAVSVVITDEFGKVDLNAAPPVVLSRLFQAGGLGATAADELAGRLDAWRQGGEPAFSGGSTSTPEPVRRVYRLVNEILLLQGMTPTLFARIEPALTLFSGNIDVDRATAPYEALLASGGLTPQEAEAMVEARTSGEGAPPLSSAVEHGRVAAGIDQRGWPYRIRSHFQLGRQFYSLDATIRLTGAAGPSYVTMRYDFSGASGP